MFFNPKSSDSNSPNPESIAEKTITINRYDMIDVIAASLLFIIEFKYLSIVKLLVICDWEITITCNKENKVTDNKIPKRPPIP